jgi:hypothetical protein
MKYIIYKINKFNQNSAIRVAIAIIEDKDSAITIIEVEPRSAAESMLESVSNLLLLACKFVAVPIAPNISNT